MTEILELKNYNSSLFSVDLIPSAEPSEIFVLKAKVEARLEKGADPVDLTVGAVRDEEGNPVIFDSVQRAEEIILQRQKDRVPGYNKEYLGIEGHKKFINLAPRLYLGKLSHLIDSGKVATVQSISGTGALSLGTSAILQVYSNAKFLIPEHTWANHNKIITSLGGTFDKYPILKKSGILDFNAVYDYLANYQHDGVVCVVLQASCFNPTGLDFTKDEWRQLSTLFQKRNFLAFFDIAYQGLGSLEFNEDSTSIRAFVKHEVPSFVAQSFAKNMGLYGERIGSLSYISRDKDSVKRMFGFLKTIIRAGYSNPPKHGAMIVSEILSDKELLDSWLAELQGINKMIAERRSIFVKKMVELDPNGEWELRLGKGNGMFGLLGLSKEQILKLRDLDVFMPIDSRVSFGGLRKEQIERLMEAIASVL